MPQAQLSGIIGDRAHTYGYHRGRDFVANNDYSAVQADDRQGSGQAACALDVSLSDADMKTVTQRLIDAVRKKDPRLKSVREFYGTINGTTVTGRDVRTGNVVTSDPSHLWHEHVSFYRRWGDDEAECRKVAEVFAGKGSPTPPPSEDDDMPKQIVLSNASGQKTAISKASEWYPVGWDAKQASTGGLSMVLPDAASLFTMTVDLTFDKLPPDHNAYIRVQTLDRNNKQRALYPVAELRGTTGATALSYSRVGSVSAKCNMRILVSSTAVCNITSAQWRCLYW